MLKNILLLSNAIEPENLALINALYPINNRHIILANILRQKIQVI